MSRIRTSVLVVRLCDWFHMCYVVVHTCVCVCMYLWRQESEQRARMVSRDNARRDVGVMGGGDADGRLQRQRYAMELQQQVEAKKVGG